MLKILFTQLNTCDIMSVSKIVEKYIWNIGGKTKDGR